MANGPLPIGIIAIPEHNRTGRALPSSSEAVTGGSKAGGAGEGGSTAVEISLTGYKIAGCPVVVGPRLSHTYGGLWADVASISGLALHVRCNF